MIQKFTVKGRLMGRNEFDYASRSHWSKASQAKQSEQERVIWAMKEAGIKPVNGPIEIAFNYYEKRQRNGRLRDCDNIHGGASKVVLDAMKTAGIIKDDSPKYVRNTYPWFAFNQADPRIEITIADYDPNGRTVYFPPIEGLD